MMALYMLVVWEIYCGLGYFQVHALHTKCLHCLSTYQPTPYGLIEAAFLEE